MVLPINTYDKYLTTCSRYKPKPRMMCECGKEIYESQQENHRNTKTHMELLRRKNYVPPDRSKKPIHPAFLASS